MHARNMQRNAGSQITKNRKEVNLMTDSSPKHQTQKTILYGEGHELRCIWNVYMGAVRFSIYEKDNLYNGQTFTVLDPLEATLLRMVCDIGRSDTGTPQAPPMHVKRYDDKSRKYVFDYSLAFVKEKSGKVLMEIDIGQGGLRFSFPRLNYLTFSDAPLIEAEQSLMQLRSFYRWLNNTAPVEKAMTRVSNG